MISRLSYPFPFRIIVYLCTLMIILNACGGDDDPNECTGLSPTYTADIKPILDASCAKSGCHDAITAQNGVNLSNYTTASAVSQEERFLGVIQHRVGFTPMPFDGAKLPDHQVQLLTCWVEDGSPE